MQFEHQIAFGGAPDQVRAMLADPSFRERVCEALHTTRHDVRVEPKGAGMTVVVDQTRPARGIPAFATKIVGDDIRIVRREDWDDGTRAALMLEIPGKPARLDGHLSLHADPGGDGTVETVTGEVKVRIPVVGGRLESLVGDLLHRALEAEERVGKAWLAGER
jgi:Protein of unknown function (DUF2505)